MKRLMEVALGMVTGIGGFLEVGSIATSAQAGADFAYALLWAVALGTLSLIVLLEMSGRLALVSQRPLADAMRERFGITYFVWPLVIGLVVSLLVLASEIGGVAIAVEMVTGVAFAWWAVPVAVVAWVLLWKGTFGALEKGTALLGLVSVAIVVAAVKLHPQWPAVAAGLAPTSPSERRAHYWFLAVSILGASISPYLYYFYSAGAIEEHWDLTFLSTNRLTAALGNALGGALTGAVLVVAALVFHTRGVQLERVQQLGGLLTPAIGRAGFWCVVAILAINCFGATVEVALACAYLLAQTLGWEWAEDARPREHARFSLTYTLAVAVAAVPVVLGVDVLKLTNFSMALTSASLPVTVLPLLVLMNDTKLLHKHRNRMLGNLALGAIALLSIVLLVVALPLQILGGG
jgi:Mn2+/Fe2+ NRAMP family transporter